MSSIRLTVFVLCAFVAVTHAQVVLTTNPVASSGGSTEKNVVRGPLGQLYALSVFDDGTGNRPLLLQISVDGGMTWTNDPFVFNDATSGLTGPVANSPANVCALAIDSTGTLHAMWGRHYYPSFFRQYYRSYSPTTLTASPIVDLTTLFGVLVTSRSDAMTIVVDSSDYVYMATQSASSWVSKLIRSNQPGGAGGAFMSFGNISPTASSQAPSLVIDFQGLIHCSFYRNIGAGTYEHRTFDPVTSTFAATTTVLGNTTPSNDFFGRLAADALGNVHALYVMDAFAPSTWLFRYRRWDATNGWSTETPLFDATQVQYTGIANYQVFSLACEEMTGRAFAVYRDLANGGALRLAEKGLADMAFTNRPDLAPAATGLHEYYAPTIRGSLNPPFNFTGTSLDITWNFRPNGSQPFSLIFAQAPTASNQVAISLSAPATLGTVTTVDLLSSAEPNGAFLCAFALGNTPGITLADSRVVPLNFDVLFQFSLTPNNGVFVNNSGLLDGSGQASVVFIVPSIPSLANLTIYSAFVTADPMSLTGVGTISPSLSITLQ